MKPGSEQINRRDALKWVAAAAGTVALMNAETFGAPPVSPGVPVPGGYGTDPNLMKMYDPGEFWPPTFNDEQRLTVKALCDVIIPADDKSPSASAAKVPEFIDEWISAPYPAHEADKTKILKGLEWLGEESSKRFGKPFQELGDSQKMAICDDVCFLPKAKPEFKQAASFFATFRNLTASGFYTTKEGMKDIGYIGNIPQQAFRAPPQEVLQRLGLV